MGYNSRVKIYAVLTLLLTVGVARADEESAVQVGPGEVRAPQVRPDQIRRNVVHASRKEGAAEEGRLGHLGMRCRSEPGWMV